MSMTILKKYTLIQISLPASPGRRFLKSFPYYVYLFLTHPLSTVQFLPFCLNGTCCTLGILPFARTFFQLFRDSPHPAYLSLIEHCIWFPVLLASRDTSVLSILVLCPDLALLASMLLGSSFFHQVVSSYRFSMVSFSCYLDSCDS